MKFLAIDDNLVDLLIAKAAVQRFNPGFEAVTAESADDALHYLRQNTKNLPDVILLDLNMPLKNGWDFLKEFKLLNISGIKIYILTSSVNEAEKIKAGNDSLVAGFLSKPLRLETLEMICNSFNQTISK